MVHENLLDFHAPLRGHMFGDEHARRFPDPGIDGRIHEQHVARHVFEDAALCVAQHVAVGATARCCRREPDAGQDFAEFVDDDPAALGRVVLIELHAVGFVDLPVELIYENALSCLEVIDQKLPVLMHVLKREARGAHMLCPLDLSVGTDQGQHRGALCRRRAVREIPLPQKLCLMEL